MDDTCLCELPDRSLSASMCLQLLDIFSILIFIFLCFILLLFILLLKSGNLKTCTLSKYQPELNSLSSAV